MIRQDLFGWIDMVALGRVEATDRVIGIQSCGQAWAAHVRTVLARRVEVERWLACGGVGLVIGWRKMKRPPPGYRRGSFVPRVWWIKTAADLALSGGRPVEDAPEPRRTQELSPELLPLLS